MHTTIFHLTVGRIAPPAAPMIHRTAHRFCLSAVLLVLAVGVVGCVRSDGPCQHYRSPKIDSVDMRKSFPRPALTPLPSCAFSPECPCPQ